MENIQLALFLFLDEVTFEVISIDSMERRVSEFREKIQGILNYNSNLWKRQLDKVKEDEEKAKKRAEIDEQLEKEKQEQE